MNVFLEIVNREENKIYNWYCFLGKSGIWYFIVWCKFEGSVMYDVFIKKGLYGNVIFNFLFFFCSK